MVLRYVALADGESCFAENRGGNSGGLLPGSYCCCSLNKGPTDGLVHLA